MIIQITLIIAIIVWNTYNVLSLSFLALSILKIDAINPNTQRSAIKIYNGASTIDKYLKLTEFHPV